MSPRQPDFAAALLDPAAAVPEGLCDAKGRPAGRRFDVYRNNVTASLVRALHEGFPVTAKLVGAKNMDRLALAFLRAHPPASPLMMFYGGRFPAFLQEQDQIAHLGYLPDTARLEFALREAYHAADAAPIEAADLASLPPEALPGARLIPAPSLRCIRSPWPVFDIWRYNTVDGAPKPQPGAQDVLITRPGFDPVPQLLPPGGAAWIGAMMNGADIASALDSAAQETADFDLGPVLSMLLEGGAITRIDSKG